MWVQDCYKNGIHKDTKMIQEKVKSSHDNLKQKEGEGSKAGEFNANKGWFDNFLKRFGFLNVKIMGEAVTTNQEMSSQRPLRRSLRRKDFCLCSVCFLFLLCFGGPRWHARS